MTVRDLTGRAVVVTTVTTITTTTLVTTTGILVLDATKGTEVSNLTNLPTMGPSSPGYPPRAGHLQRDCKKNTGASSSGHADKKPDASGRVFALTQDQAANTS
ncbi:hypothetical protein Tco_0119815, partial [Tanacetum coccineum]